MRDLPSYPEHILAASRRSSSLQSDPRPRLHITGQVPSKSPKVSSSSKSQKEFDGASVASTSTFSSTVSLIKSVKDKLHRETPGKMTKEQKKQLQQERRREEEANGPVQWIPDINGDNKSPRQRTTEAYMITGMLK